ncbi:MAG: 2-dehydro-3-deoxy-D-gluconate 5-dehydrogenase [Thermoanaerobaculia bacterium]|nr:2-dehydro-3-deoxy-D-gluconate 5-dehydrogenase [Thermoanaerobaculia bacterium]
MSLPGLSLSGKVAAVVGGTSGIGLGLVRGLAMAGADVIPISRTRQGVESAASEVEGLGRKTTRITADVTRRDSLESALAGCLATLGRVDILVNCAATTRRRPALDLLEDDWNRIIDTNLTGTLRCCQVFGRHMLERGSGRIVNIASLASFVGLLEVAAYDASKAAVAALTRSLAIEWGPRGVNVNAIAPGVFRTPLNQELLDGTERGREFVRRTPLKRYGKVEELQGACVLLSSDAASFINGDVLVVDGGLLAAGVLS